ncbi:Na+/H+ antiporter NhaA [Actinophytocola sediminis]
MSSSAPPPSWDGTTTRTRDVLAQLARPFRVYLANPAAAAGLLLAATVIALLWANSPWSASYDAFWHTELAISFGGGELSLDLRHWVNDGLMVFFFFVVGLEVKRELAVGELADRRTAAVPLAAAVTGLAVPAAVYLLFNPGGEAARAWGVVISTDTAFLLGVLALVGPACPGALRMFLLTLAVADDVGALTIIALFYTEDLSLTPLVVSLVGLALMVGLRYLRVWRGPAYFVFGVAVWIAMYLSGVHPTIAGVVIALFTPAYAPRRDEVAEATRLTRAFSQSPGPELARAARLGIERSVPSADRLHRLYEPYSSYLIVPLFALANAGVSLSGDTLSAALTSPVTLGIIAGLVLGKLLGISVGAYGAVALKLGTLSRGLTRGQLLGGAALSGIGFTISLFIVDLALGDSPLADQARVGVLAASLLAALLGWALFRFGDRRRDEDRATAGVLVPPVDPDRDHLRGPVDAPMTLVEYGDFECPFCGRATGAVDEVLHRLGDRVRYVFRHLPLVDVHPHAELAAEAAEAAGAQGRYWDMHARLYANQDRLKVTALVEHATAIGLDLARFTRDLGDSRYAGHVRDDAESAEASGATGTPTFFVGDRRHTGSFDANTLVARLLESIGETAPEPTDRPVLLLPDPTPRTTVVVPDRIPAGADQETDGDDSAYPRLSEEHLAVLDRHGARHRVEPGRVLFAEGDPGYNFHVIVAGTVATVQGLGGPAERVRAVSGAGRFVGELGLFAGQSSVITALATTDSEVIELTPVALHAAFVESSGLREVVLRAMLLRRSRFLEETADVRIIGPAADQDTRRLRDWATDNGLTHHFVDIDQDAGAAGLLADLDVHHDELPVVIWRDTTVLRNPTPDDLAALD